MVVIYSVLRILAVALFLYLAWRKLRHDYDEEGLMSYLWMFMLMFLIGGRLVYGMVHWGVWNDSVWDWMAVFTKSGFDYFGGYFIAMLFSFFYLSSRSWKIWNLAEDMTMIFVVFMLMMLSAEIIGSGFSVEAMLWLVWMILLAVVVNLLSGKYRSFAWYKSGKKGFLFLVANILFPLGSLGLVVFLGGNWMMMGALIAWCLISVLGLVMLGDIAENLKVSK